MQLIKTHSTQLGQIEDSLLALICFVWSFYLFICHCLTLTLFFSLSRKERFKFLLFIRRHLSLQPFLMLTLRFTSSKTRTMTFRCHHLIEFLILETMKKMKKKILIFHICICNFHHFSSINDKRLLTLNSKRGERCQMYPQCFQNYKAFLSGTKIQMLE